MIYLKCLIRNIGVTVVLWVLLNLVTGETPLVLFYDLKSGFRYHLAYPAGIAVIVLLVVLKEWKGIRLSWKVRIGSSRFIQIPPSGNSRYRWLFTAGYAALCIAFAGAWALSGSPAKRGQSWQGDPLIGHSFSGIDGLTYTGSLEAFLEGYANGYRTFEVDIIFTSDDELVLAHGWAQSAEAAGRDEWNDMPPTMDEFLETPAWGGGYTLLTLADLFNIMENYPDIWIVTDTKYTDTEQVRRQFQKLVDTARENGCMDVLDRVIVQLYHEKMYAVIQKIYPFQSYIFTMYQRWWGDPGEFGALCRWCLSHGVWAVTTKGDISYEEAWRIARAYGLDVYVHTINDISEADVFFESGVSGIYTDFIRREELKED